MGFDALVWGLRCVLLWIVTVSVVMSVGVGTGFVVVVLLAVECRGPESLALAE